MESMDKLCTDPFNELVQLLIDGSETAAMILGRVLPLSTNTQITYVCLSLFFSRTVRALLLPPNAQHKPRQPVWTEERVKSSVCVFQVRQSPIIFLPTSARAPSLSDSVAEQQPNHNDKNAEVSKSGGPREWRKLE